MVQDTYDGDGVVYNCDCFLEGEECVCEEGCECACTDCVCTPIDGCACGGNCSCGAEDIEEEETEPNLNYLGGG